MFFLLLRQKKNPIAAPIRRQATPTPTPTPMPMVAPLERPPDEDDDDDDADVAGVLVEAVAKFVDVAVAEEIEAAELVAAGVDWSPVMLK